MKLREEVWRLLEENGVTRFPTPIRGRIPNFEGSHVAARRILDINELDKADVIKVNPDYPQLMIRKGILDAGKTLIMPSPRLRSGFLILVPSRIPRRLYRKASTIKGAFLYGKSVDLYELPVVDLVVCGSVAVTSGGVRVGKGGGYSDLEYAILRERGLINEKTSIVTSVHELQIVEDAPREEHDFTVDQVATPKRLLKTSGSHYRPDGILWEMLPEKKLETMPILRMLRQRSSSDYNKT